MKSTSVASLIGITEITRTAVLINTVTFEPFRVFGTVCLVYFAICYPFSFLSDRFGARLDRKRAGGLGDVFRRVRRSARSPKHGFHGPAKHAP